MADTIDWPPPRRPSRGRGPPFALLVARLLLLSAGTALSYYVDALWFESLGVGDVFWRTLNIQAGIFSGFTIATFVVLYGGPPPAAAPRPGPPPQRGGGRGQERAG